MTPSLHLNVYRREYEISLSRPLQTFELSEMVAEVLVRCGTVAQDLFQGATDWDAEVVVDIGKVFILGLLML